MDSYTDPDLSSKLTYYSTSSSVSKMPKHMVSSQAVNKEPQSSVRKTRKESATQAPRNKPCQTESCRGKLVSTGVNYEQPNTSSTSTRQSNQHSSQSYPFSNNPPSPSCLPPPPPSCYPPSPPRPCSRPPSCYPPPPPPCPRSMPDSQHSQQSQNYMPYPQFYSPDPNRMGKSCWYRMPPPCPYPLYPQYDMAAQLHNQHMNDQDEDRDQWQYPKQYALMPNDSHDAAYDDINDGFDMNGFNHQYEYDDENFDENVCSDCRFKDNDEEQMWQEQLNMQLPHCSPPPSFSYYTPPQLPATPQCFPRPKCCPAYNRHCKKMQTGADMRNIECDHCKAKAPNMECNHCKSRAQRLADMKNIDCDHCQAKPPNMECTHCKNKALSQQNEKGLESEYQHQYNKKSHKRQ